MSDRPVDKSARWRLRFTKRQYLRITNLLSLLKQNSREYWPAIFDAIKHKESTTAPREDLVFFWAVTFLDKLLEAGCSDANRVDSILKLYGFYCAKKYQYLPSKELREAFYSDVCQIFHDNCHCAYVFYDAGTPFDTNLLEFAVRANDLKFMTALFKYGFGVPDSSSCSKSSEAETKTKPIEFWKDVDYRRRLVKEKMFDILSNAWARQNSPASSLESFGPVYTDQQISDGVQCIKLYFLITADPLISKDEIVKYSSDNWHGAKDFLPSVAQLYRDQFPEEAIESATPRTLQHMCRCSIRKSLAEKKVGVLSELVEISSLPKRIKSYLLCEY